MANSNWIHLKSSSLKNIWIDCELLLVNNTEFAVVPYSSDADGIYKYQINNNEWIKAVDYHKDFKSTLHGTTLDKKNQLLYGSLNRAHCLRQKKIAKKLIV